jgi:hypothetical protein
MPSMIWGSHASSSSTGMRIAHTCRETGTSRKCACVCARVRAAAAGAAARCGGTRAHARTRARTHARTHAHTHTHARTHTQGTSNATRAQRATSRRLLHSHLDEAEHRLDHLAAAGAQQQQHGGQQPAHEALQRTRKLKHEASEREHGRRLPRACGGGRGVCVCGGGGGGLVGMQQHE